MAGQTRVTLDGETSAWDSQERYVVLSKETSVQLLPQAMLPWVHVGASAAAPSTLELPASPIVAAGVL